ncbi:unnamed protein product [Lathyrus sativus]|nr:unnamed protein product [Lathyrus sativus]
MQVPDTTNSSIIAMASSSKKEFLTHYRSVLNCLSGSHRFWNAKSVSRVANKLGLRLRKIGVTGVQINVSEELSRPLCYRKMVFSLFRSVQHVDVRVSSAYNLPSF